MLNWHCKAFNQLTVPELYSIMKARQEVFVVEQNCVYTDLDDKDSQCLHLFATLANSQIEGTSAIQENDTVVAYLRIFPPTIQYTQASIGRILTTSQARGTGAGKVLVTKAIALLQRDYAGTKIKISAQLYLQEFYQSFGFSNTSEVYKEDGIDHIEMLLGEAV
jgi:ElaA protein